MPIEKPAPGEYNEFYGGYISLMQDDDLFGVLAEQPQQLSALTSSLDESRGSQAYAEGKWTIKELLSHLIDGERHFSYRVHRISRGDETPIEGFEQDDYVANSRAQERSFSDLAGEFGELRAANLRMLGNLGDADWQRMGTASGYPISVRALAFIMAGHVRHHTNVLKERYLVQ